MYCPFCGAIGEGTLEYCANCGLIHLNNCPNCDTEIPAGEMACPNCGARVWSFRGSPTDRTSPLNLSQPEKNRKARLELIRSPEPAAVASLPGSRQAQVSVLTAYVEVAAHDGRDETPRPQQYISIDELMQPLVQVVEESGGYLHEYTHTGLVAVYGLPQAHESDPETALRAGFKMLEITDHAVEIRLGIHTGPARVISLAEPAREIYALAGKTPELAALLAQSAQPGTLLVDRATYLRTRQLCDFRPLPGTGDFVLNREEMAYHAKRLKERCAAHETLPEPDPAHVGRDDELAAMQAALERARRGRNHVALVSAAPGMGKSHLLRRFRLACGAARFHPRVYSVSATTLTLSGGYHLVGDLIKTIAGIREQDPDPLRRKVLREYLERMDLPSDDYYTYLVKLVTSHAYETGYLRSLDDADSEQARVKTYAVLRGLLLAEARLHTLVLIFDDVHFADTHSLAMLSYLLGAVRRAGILFVFTTQPGETRNTAALFEAAHRRPDVLTEIVLEALPAEDVRLLVERLIAPTPLAGMAGVADHIVRNAHGSPFVIHEMLRVLLEKLDTGPVEGASKPAEKIARLTASLSGDIQALALVRFERLPAELRLILQRAAVLGATFDLTTLIRATHENEHVLRARLRELDQREFLAANAFGYSFESSLVQQAVYATIPHDERKKLHDHAATAIHGNQTWFGAGMVEELCRHYLNGSVPRRAVPYLFRAADEAQARYDRPGAIAHYRVILELQAGFPTGPEMREAQLGLGRALKGHAEYRQAADLLEDALAGATGALREQPNNLQIRRWRMELIAELADTRLRQGRLKEAQHLLQNGLDSLEAIKSPEQVVAWRGLTALLAWTQCCLGNLQEAMTLAETAANTPLVNDPHERRSMITLYLSQGCVHYSRRNILEAKLYLEKSLSLSRSINFLEGISAAFACLGELNMATGDFISARQDFELSLEAAGQLRDVRLEAFDRISLGHVYLAVGDLQAAHEQIETGLKICERIEDAWNAGIAHVALAMVEFASGSPEVAIQHVSHAIRLAHSTGSQELQAYTQALDSLSWGEMGKVHAAVEAARGALAKARDGGYIGIELFCLQTLALALQASYAWQEAEKVIESGLILARNKFDRFQEARCIFLLAENARLQAQSASRAEADAMRARALRLYTQACSQWEVLGARRMVDLSRQTIRNLEES